MAKFNFKKLSDVEKKKVIADLKEKGVVCDMDGKITKLPTTLATYRKEFVTSVSSVDIEVNTEGSEVLVLGLDKPIKFLSNETGAMEDKHRVRLNGSISEFVADLGIMRAQEKMEDLDAQDKKQLFSAVKRLGLTVTVAVIEDANGFFNSADIVLPDYNKDIVERFKSNLAQFEDTLN